MAAGDNYTNSFIVKTMTLARIAGGVVLTLAVLFALVWLTDFSAGRDSGVSHQQSVLLSEHASEADTPQPQTFFETLLKKKPDTPPAPAMREEKMPDRRRLPERVEPSPRPTADRRGAVPHPPASRPSATGMFTVQLGSFQQEDGARNFADRLVAGGYAPYIVQTSLSDGTIMYRVRAGRFASREEAMTFAAALERSERISVFVTAYER